MTANRRQIGQTMRILVLGVLLLALGGCAVAGTEEREQWDAALWALGSAMVQFGNQQIEAERLRQSPLQQSVPRQAIWPAGIESIAGTRFQRHPFDRPFAALYGTQKVVKAKLAAADLSYGYL